MASLTTKVTGNFDDGYVLLEVSSKKTNPRCYKVPEDKIDEFSSGYKKLSQKMNFWSNFALCGTILAAGSLIYPFIKNLKSVIARMAIGVTGGIAAATVSTVISASEMAKCHDKFLAKYNAEEISCEKQTIDKII